MLAMSRHGRRLQYSTSHPRCYIKDGLFIPMNKLIRGQPSAFEERERLVRLVENYAETFAIQFAIQVKVLPGDHSDLA